MIKVTATMNSVQTPHTLGYRWPAEWEPHAATWISWPHNRATWPDRFQRVPECFATIIRTLAQYEPVQVLSGGEPVMDEAQKMVGDLANVTLHNIPTNDAWIRDYGPTFIQAPGSREVAAIDWRFNAWGGKYPPWDLDNAVPVRITQQLGMRRFPVDVVMEGGSIDGNGRGAILTTQSCLLDSQRNAGMHRQQLERILLQYCSASHVIWIAGGPMAGDDTDGHVDQLARFVSPNQIVVAVENDPQDENYQSLRTNLRCSRRVGISGPNRWKSSRCLCRTRSTSINSESLRATATSTLPMAACWCRCSTTPPTTKPVRFSNHCFPVGPSSDLPPAISLGDSEHFTA